MRHISEQFVELANRLLNIADLGLAFDDECFVEVDFGLIGENGLLLLELELLLRRGVRGGGGLGLFERGRVCGALFVQCLPLKRLKLCKRGLEFLVQLVLGILLRWLCSRQSAALPHNCLW